MKLKVEDGVTGFLGLLVKMLYDKNIEMTHTGLIKNHKTMEQTRKLQAILA